MNDNQWFINAILNNLTKLIIKINSARSTFQQFSYVYEIICLEIIFCKQCAGCKWGVKFQPEQLNAGVNKNWFQIFCFFIFETNTSFFKNDVSWSG